MTLLYCETDHPERKHSDRVMTVMQNLQSEREEIDRREEPDSINCLCEEVK